jgi:hypothetical protein
MSDFFENWDPAERLLAAGALNLTLGVTGVIGLEALAVSGAVTLSVVGAAGAIAVAPALLVAGAYALTTSDKEGWDLLDAASKTSEAVKAGTRAIDWIEDQMKARWHVPEGVKPDKEAPSTRERDLLKETKEKGKDSARDSGQDLSDRLLKRPDSEKGTRSRDDPASTRSSSHVDGPSSDRGDRRQHGHESSDDDGPVQRMN